MKFLFFLLKIFIVFCISLSAFSQKISVELWPIRPIRLIIPAAAGGPIDVIARIIGQKITNEFNVPVVYDNKAGANGIIGIDSVAKSNPDGYTMLIVSGSFSANSFTYKKLPYDPIKDFSPITQIYQTYGNLLIVNSELPVLNLTQLIEYASKNKLSYSSAGYGNLTHLNGELFNSVASTNIVHVPYKGAGPAFNEVLSKHIDMTFASTATAIQSIKEGRVRALAIGGTKRAPVLENVPTYAEAGLKGMEQAVYGWCGLWYPSKTPEEKILKIQQSIAKIINLDDVKEKFDKLGLVGIGSSPSEFTKFIENDIQFQSKLFKIAKIEPL